MEGSVLIVFYTLNILAQTFDVLFVVKPII